MAAAASACSASSPLWMLDHLACGRANDALFLSMAMMRDHVKRGRLVLHRLARSLPGLAAISAVFVACGRVAALDRTAGIDATADAGAGLRDAGARDAHVAVPIDARAQDASVDALVVDARRVDVVVPDASAPAPEGGCDGGSCASCPSSCATDDDCANGCPAAAGEVSCCDAVTSACFESASTVCPDQGCGACTSDMDCQTTCPGALTQGIAYCCDPGSLTCLESPTNACPSPPICSTAPTICGWNGSCDSVCPPAPPGSSNCCAPWFGGPCYVSPTPTCP